MESLQDELSCLSLRELTTHLAKHHLSLRDPVLQCGLVFLETRYMPLVRSVLRVEIIESGVDLADQVAGLGHRLNPACALELKPVLEGACAGLQCRLGILDPLFNRLDRRV